MLLPGTDRLMQLCQSDLRRTRNEQSLGLVEVLLLHSPLNSSTALLGRNRCRIERGRMIRVIIFIIFISFIICKDPGRDLATGNRIKVPSAALNGEI